MALTQEDIDRILGKQSILDRVLQSNQPTISAQKGLSGEYGNYINNPNNQPEQLNIEVLITKLK